MVGQISEPSNPFSLIKCVHRKPWWTYSIYLILIFGALNQSWKSSHIMSYWLLKSETTFWFSSRSSGYIIFLFSPRGPWFVVINKLSRTFKGMADAISSGMVINQWHWLQITWKGMVDAVSVRHGQAPKTRQSKRHHGGHRSTRRLVGWSQRRWSLEFQLAGWHNIRIIRLIGGFRYFEIFWSLLFVQPYLEWWF